MSRWLPVVGYEGIYEVSDSGEVRSIDRTILSPTGKDRFLPGKVIGANIDNAGYLRTRLSRDNKMKNFSVHRLVAMAFIPPIDGKTCVNHKDSNKLNNHADNLEWCTHQENTHHAIASDNFPSKKKFCKYGHPNTPENRDKYNHCKPCNRRKAREQTARKRALRAKQRANLREDK